MFLMIPDLFLLNWTAKSVMCCRALLVKVMSMYMWPWRREKVPEISRPFALTAGSHTWWKQRALTNLQLLIARSDVCVHSLLLGVRIPQWWWPCPWRARTSRSGRCWQPEGPVSAMEQKCLELMMGWSSDPPKTTTAKPSGQHREASLANCVTGSLNHAKGKSDYEDNFKTQQMHLKSSSCDSQSPQRSVDMLRCDMNLKSIQICSFMCFSPLTAKQSKSFRFK